ncbi:cation diffusion facilitator family transporter [Desulfosporosinus sp. PR]|uniref:cation diffusion facilitator family transporter n=1 Tax=Candidatus Desulfosporosinus nitrosoreducens TaxID=3401928 RepID=UPI0027F6DCB6|nr:cation diffusion facilitator family transporter [Desulfosporosinus sp. PR]MDQ7095518.1 cation diffusion facilitator family transporter [Desulfosporosinus sp. PR]
MNDKTQVATLSVASNSFLTLTKIVIGVLSGSVSILSEGIHSGIDLVAAFIALFAVRESGKPADSRHAYGHGKIENVSGTIEAVLIFIAAVMIIFKALQKAYCIFEGNAGSAGNLGIGMIIMGFSSLINFAVSRQLMKVAKRTESIALEADALHLRTDVYTSAGVFCGLLLIKATGWIILDPIVALGVALLILKTSFELTKEAFSPLVDVSLPEEEREIISGILKLHADEFVEFHELRTRRAGAERHVDLHLVVAKYTPVVDAHDLCDRIELEINKKLHGTHILIHAEPCGNRGEACSLEETTSPICRHCQEKNENEARHSGN